MGRVYFDLRLVDVLDKKHADLRKPLRRFLSIAQKAAWPRLVAVKQSFPATDYAHATGTLIFDKGGNKYRLLARLDFEEQILSVQRVPRHEEYNRENL